MFQPSENPPEEFAKLIKDFVSDLKTTFPEYNPLINKWWKDAEMFNYIEEEEERQKAICSSESNSCKLLFSFCKNKLPPRFFDILYQNEELFKPESEYDTEFLPHIHFKNLWQCDITDKTRETIWKYLQLILFSIVGTLDNKDMFGDSAKLFEAVNEEDFKKKLEETLSHMQGLFNTPEGEGDSRSEGTNSSFNMEDMPNASDLHEHITGMLDGQLGKLAKEIAEETAESLNMDMENVTDMKDVFDKLIKNPTKLMGLVKTVGDKLDTRIKSGEIKESELMAEATDIMNKMKNMPGMGNIQSMLSKMGMGNLGGKMNTGAMEAQLNRNMKTAKMKERIRAKAEAAQLAKLEKQMKETLQQASLQQQTNAVSDEDLIKIFSTGEKVERTPRGAPPQTSTTNATKNKKKNKK
jgi:hypothetical protein